MLLYNLPSIVGIFLRKFHCKVCITLIHLSTYPQYCHLYHLARIMKGVCCFFFSSRYWYSDKAVPLLSVCPKYQLSKTK